MVDTYLLLAPVNRVPDNVVASLVVSTQNLRGHGVVLGKPKLTAFIPAPVA